MKSLSLFLAFGIISATNAIYSQDLETGLEPTSVSYYSADGSVDTEPIRKASDWSPVELDRMFRRMHKGARTGILGRTATSKLIQDELEMSDQQRTAAFKAMQSFNTENAELQRKFEVDGVLPEGSRQLLEKQSKTLVTNLFETLERELLPHQIKQVDALASRYAYQWVLSRLGSGAELRWPLILSKSLGLSSWDQEKLKTEIEEIEREMNEEISKVRQDALKKLLTKLPPEAKKVFEEASQEQLDPKVMAEVFK